MKKERDERLYFDDILESIGLIEEYTKGISYSDFSEKRMIQDAVVRKLEIIGEAVKNISPKKKRDNPEVPWKQIAGTRDVLIHEYFGVNLRRIWKIIKKDLPSLKRKIIELSE